MKIGEFSSTARRGNSPAQPINQCFLSMIRSQPCLPAPTRNFLNLLASSTLTPMPILRLYLLLISVLLAGTARAEMTIEIGTGAARQIPVAIVPFANDREDLTPVIKADLQRSGLFRLVDTAGVNPQPTDASVINHSEWQGRGADALAVGSASSQPDGSIKINFRLYDPVRKTQIAGMSYTARPTHVRATAHRIADVIYEKLTGDRGIFSTRIAYILKQGKRYQLQVADSDGENAQTVLASNEPIISPRWSKDGSKLAYVSYEERKPIVYSHHLASNQRRVVSNQKGSNSSPAWSPDGAKMAVTLTKDGLSQIYEVELGSGRLTRLTRSSGIDTEADYSPDGRSIVFLSDRGGSPQLYQMPASGGEARRLTFDGNYSVSPRYSPDGKSITYIKRDSGRFQVAILDLASGVSTTLSDTSNDESPSFAPNGKMILYATELGGRGALAVVSSDGRIKQRLRVLSGEVREPAWGP